MFSNCTWSPVNETNILDPAPRRSYSVSCVPLLTCFQWEVTPEPLVELEFPPPDLIHDLVEIYFKQVNIFSFILHRPTFERSLADGLHFRDPEFGAVVLAVCALGSKNSTDERVILPGEYGALSAGWEWFRQIRRPFSGHALKTASLYELQLCCVGH